LAKKIQLILIQFKHLPKRVFVSNVARHEVPMLVSVVNVGENFPIPDTSVILSTII